MSKTIGDITELGGAIADADLIELETAAGNSRRAAFTRLKTWLLAKLAGEAIGFDAGITLGGGADVFDEFDFGQHIPDVTFGTMGTFVPSYATPRYVDYLSNGKFCSLSGDVQFDTNGYTGASGSFGISLPFAHTGDAAVTINVTIRFTAFPSSTLYVCGQIVPGQSKLILVGVKQSANWTAFGTTEFPASTSNFRILFNGVYQVG